ncbi:Endonuclease/exonuclease/phosphatase [Mycena amicta]|nr:Endonuclease/exonuclease/phosphatase [Mycena amicta]
MEHYILERWKVALDYIETLEPSPAILLFQETHTAALPVVLEHPFVRKSFLLSNVSPPPGSQYSTLILVSRALAARCKSVTATRVPYDALTKMQRDCLYVELDIQSRRFRIATTHLESLHGFGTIARPKQLALAANLLKAEGIDGGLVAGDMNCIGQNEKDLPERTGLVDAWTSIKAKPTSEDEEKDAHTWGYQPPSQYAPLRMDKILTVGKLEAVNIQRVGVGLEAQVAPDDDDDDKVWVSDHYGLLAEIVLR